MATYTVQPLNYVSENLFTELPNWELVNGSAAKLVFQLKIEDALGTRRFLPPVGAQVSMSFVRSRAPSVGSTATVITKYATQLLPTSDKSIYQVDIPAAEVALIVTGGVKLTLTMAGGEVSFSLPHMVKKVVSAPGF